MRIFERASTRGTDLLLKMIKVFALSLTGVNSAPNIEQQAAVKDIPDTLDGLERRFNLGIESVPYAVCPQCSCIYPPSYSSGAAEPAYPTTCSEPRTKLGGPCGAELLENGKPAKFFEYYPFFEWFAKFIALPGIEAHGDRFCDDVTRQQGASADKCNACDGRFVYEFRAADGSLFVSERGEEGRWFFMFHADFFNIEGNRIRGKKTTTGVMGATCLNLPAEIRDDSAYKYIPAFIQGPLEPNGTKAEHRYYLRPFITDMEKAYTRGLQPYRRGLQPNSDNTISQRVFRVAIASVSMDFKAARPFAGLADVTSHTFCFVCQCWHLAHLGRTDFESWDAANDDFLRKGAEQWDESEDKGRALIEKSYGTRYSEFWRLPYWKPSKQLIVDPMHTFYLILEQRFFRDALGLENPTDENKTRRTEADIAYHYPFTPPPPLSSIAPVSSSNEESSEQDDQWLSVIEWKDLSPSMQQVRAAQISHLKGQIILDHSAQRQIKKLRAQLSSEVLLTDPGKLHLQKRLMQSGWLALLYVCSDLVLLPSHLRQLSIHKSEIQKKDMANALVQWVSHVSDLV